MSRLTQAQIIEAENEEQALLFFKNTLSKLPDPRRRQGKRYPFESVIITALMASVCGADDAQAMQTWGEANQDWLSSLWELPYGTPTQDVFLAVLGSLNPQAFQEVFRDWAKLLSIRIKSSVQIERQLAVDGKTNRRSVDRTNGKSAIHTLNAWAVDSGVVIGQMNVDSKTNEISATPELLRLLDIKGCTISMDAMGCQAEIASQVADGGANYLLAVKENQPRLYHDIETAYNFADSSVARPLAALPSPIIESITDVNKDHGRVEERTVELCRDLSWLQEPEKWAKVAFFVRVKRRRTTLSSGKISSETAYYIGSNNNATAESIGLQIRRHWSIENELHWVLDMAFREDEARHRSRNVGKNMTIIRQFALNVIKGDKNRKLGVANSRKRAGWDHQYLLDLLVKSNP
jgi:predicted transposase YbfD/YdcC